MNSAGYDCLKAVPLPYLEFHMTNIEQSEIKSVTATECVGMICVMGINLYIGMYFVRQKILDYRHDRHQNHCEACCLFFC